MFPHFLLVISGMFVLSPELMKRDMLNITCFTTDLFVIDTFLLLVIVGKFSVTSRFIAEGVTIDMSCEEMIPAGEVKQGRIS